MADLYGVAAAGTSVNVDANARKLLGDVAQDAHVFAVV